MSPEPENFDVVVVGGGPAGLSAALMLGRCQLKTLVCDSGRYRNAPSHAMHGYLTRDGMGPREFLELARRDVARYPSVRLWSGEVTDIRHERGGFLVERQRERDTWCKKLVLATGVIDELPELEGAPELFGHGVFHCPYCDGWELRDTPLAVYAPNDDRGAELALLLTRWSADVVLCTDGRAALTDEHRERLARCHVRVDERPIARLVAERDQLSRIAFRDGSTLPRRGLFFNTGRHQASDFAFRLGCEEFQVKGCLLDSRSGKTSVAGVYVIGDASRDVLQVVVAAAEGCEAAVEINCELLREAGVL